MAQSLEGGEVIKMDLFQWIAFGVGVVIVAFVIVVVIVVAVFIFILLVTMADKKPYDYE